LISACPSGKKEIMNINQPDSPDQTDRNHSSAQDRRCHYRVDDQVFLSYKPVTLNTIRRQAAHKQFDNHQGFELLGHLKKLDDEAQSLLRDIAQQHRSIAIYLSIINKKVELIAQQSVHSSRNPEQELCRVNLSEGGISFACEHAVDVGEHLAIKLGLPNDNDELYLYGKVIRCLHSQPGGYRLALQFNETTANEQKVLTRRVLQVQMQSHRQT